MPALGLDSIGARQAVPEPFPMLLASFVLFGLLQYGKRKFLKVRT
jgi:hypothetical protein